MNRIKNILLKFFIDKNSYSNLNKIRNKKIYAIDKIIYIYISFIIVLFLINIYFRNLNSILISLILLNVYNSYLFIIYYPKERKKLISYINKILDEKKEDFILKLEKDRFNIENRDLEKIVLKDEEDYDLIEWSLKDKTSLLMGKSTLEDKVDIDFKDNEYSHLVSRQHGILNKVNGIWYYEDLASVNGSGIERKNGEKIKLIKYTPYKLESGDFLYISVIKMLIK